MATYKTTINNFVRIGFLFIFVCLFSQCARKEPFTREKAEKAIVDILEKDTGLNVVTHTEGNTLYVYLPTTEPIYEVKRDLLPSVQIPLGPTLVFTGVKYEDSDFTIEYTDETFESETKERQYHKGFDKTLTPHASKLTRAALHALTQALTLSSDRFTFFVVIVSDIKEGIEFRYTIHERDLKKWLTLGQTFDLSKTIIFESDGSLAIVNDKSGEHIIYTDISMADFLCDRIYLALLRDLNEEIKKQHPKIPW